ncbi:unnamed protein product, partial [Prorocentrum cordatum]
MTLILPRRRRRRGQPAPAQELPTRDSALLDAGPTRERERLVQGFRQLDAGCTGSVPRPVFEHVARAVCEVNPTWLQALERVLARTE